MNTFDKWIYIGLACSFLGLSTTALFGLMRRHRAFASAWLTIWGWFFVVLLLAFSGRKAFEGEWLQLTLVIPLFIVRILFLGIASRYKTDAMADEIVQRNEKQGHHEALVL